MAKKRWADQTRAERRVTIAKDVLKQLDSGKLKAAVGAYFRLRRIGQPQSEDIFEVSTALLKSTSIECHACARGAMLISHLGLVPEKTRYASFASDTEVGLRDCFSPRQLRLIECAFEVSVGFADVEDDQERAGKAVVFGEQFRDREDRMIAIMQNIVDHGGTFRPEVKYVIVAE